MNSRSGLSILAIAIMLILAGCGGGAGAQTPASETVTSTETATSTPSSTPTASPTPTPRPPQNPWMSDPVKVAVVDQTHSSRNWTAMVRQSIEFWNGEGGQYTDYEYQFELVRFTLQADVVINIVDEIEYCSGFDESTVGCAPMYEYVGAAEGERTFVEIEAGFTDESTIETMKHELGHTLGLGHSDVNRVEVMNATAIMNETAAPNATEREWPWKQTNFTVYVEGGAGVTQGHANREAKQALEYYENDPDDWLSRDISFEMTENKSAADLVIEMRAHPDCLGGDGVCWSQWGYSPDADAPLEYYSSATITVVGVDKDHYGWYVGYALGRVLGAEEESELPPPFEDSDNADDRWFN